MSTNEILNTFFDTPERDSDELVQSDLDTFKCEDKILQLLEGFPDLAVVLNEHRQIVLCNLKALEVFGAQKLIDILGKRFGEAFNCIHANENKAGCGTSRFCKECGAAKALKRSRENNIQSEEECRVIAIKDEKETSFDFFVRTQPLEHNGKIFLIFAVRDISGEKRRESLEKIFFHDVLNTASAINGLATLLPLIKTNSEREEINSALVDSSKILLNEISAQREIRYAEDGNLAVYAEETSVNKILSRASDLYSKHELTQNKKFNTTLLDDDFDIVTDSTLVIRSIGNLIKNALEATSEGGEVSLSTRNDENFIWFDIYNDAVIPDKTKIQMFQRSFSTKAAKGRGLGLYSVKLIIEQYLNGKINFVSDPENKTVFTIKIHHDFSQK